jgi:hypothetical protein
MPPVIAEIEDELEPLPGLERRSEPGRRVIDPAVLAEVLVGKADPSTIGQLKGVQMREVPAPERPVDRLSEALERHRRRDREHAPRRRLEIPAQPTDQLDLDLQPRPRHRPRTLRDRF